MKRRRGRPWRPPVSDESGAYGFDWGPLRVVRLGHVPGRGYWLHVSTPHRSLEIRASDAGLRLVAKDPDEPARTSTT